MDAKPIKRNENIAALSRDHHEGLLFSWKLRQGLKSGVALLRMRRYVAFFWDQHLSGHFQEEESLLFHPFPGAGTGRALVEHRKIQEMVDRISKSEQEPAEAYAALADLVEQHIRFEERELFPQLESIMNAEQLAAVGKALAEQHAGREEAKYGDEFWVRIP